MKDEQIKQNAEAYALADDLRYGDPYYVSRNAYISGAHSRDEEIDNLITYYENELAICQHIIDQFRNPWISVKERLPEKINKFTSEPVLCRYTKNNREYFRVSQYDFEFDESPISNVTHWMPIPETPKGCEE